MASLLCSLTPEQLIVPKDCPTQRPFAHTHTHKLRWVPGAIPELAPSKSVLSLISHNTLFHICAPATLEHLPLSYSPTFMAGHMLIPWLGKLFPQIMSSFKIRSKAASSMNPSPSPLIRSNPWVLWSPRALIHPPCPLSLSVVCGYQGLHATSPLWNSNTGCSPGFLVCALQREWISKWMSAWKSRSITRSSFRQQISIQVFVETVAEGGRWWSKFPLTLSTQSKSRLLGFFVSFK